jgi:hypothetical protein
MQQERASCQRGSVQEVVQTGVTGVNSCGMRGDLSADSPVRGLAWLRVCRGGGDSAGGGDTLECQWGTAPIETGSGIWSMQQSEGTKLPARLGSGGGTDRGDRGQFLWDAGRSVGRFTCNLVMIG